MSNRYNRNVLSHLKDYLRIAKKVKEIIKDFDQDAKIYVFGSVVKGKYTACSDIDILVITNNMKNKYEMMTAVYSKIEAPVELHIVNNKLFKKWYRRFIDDDELIEI